MASFFKAYMKFWTWNVCINTPYVTLESIKNANYSDLLIKK
ncbi:hypothetical protein NYA8BAC_01275 [Psychrobacter okhotskensis]